MKVYLHHYRTRKGWTIRKLSEVSKVSTNTIVTIEKQERYLPQMRTLESLAKALEVNVSDLFEKKELSHC